MAPKGIRKLNQKVQQIYVGVCELDAYEILLGHMHCKKKKAERDHMAGHVVLK